MIDSGTGHGSVLRYRSPPCMNTRVELFVAALAILSLARVGQTLSPRGGYRFFDFARIPSVASKCLLFLASFLTLFAELALIRWIAVEVRIFAYCITKLRTFKPSSSQPRG
jgi:hypothetical protein